MTYEEIMAIVLAAPGIVQGFAQHYIGLHEDRSVRNSGGGFQKEHNLVSYYRIVLYHVDREFSEGRVKGGLVEVEKPDLMDAVREAFELLKLPVPNFDAAKENRA